MKGFNLRVASGQLGHLENETRFEHPYRMACVDVWIVMAEIVFETAG